MGASRSPSKPHVTGGARKGGIIENQLVPPRQSASPPVQIIRKSRVTKGMGVYVYADGQKCISDAFCGSCSLELTERVRASDGRPGEVQPT